MRTNWHKEDAQGEILSPEELEVIARITEIIEVHPGFAHPIWDWLASGDYSLDQLQTFAGNYYGHVEIFRKYLAAGVMLASNEKLQEELSEILAEEYGRRYDPEVGASSPSHPELYRRFMRSIDLDPSAWSERGALASIVTYRDVHFKMVTEIREYALIGAIIFAMESATPYRHARVTQGLEKYATTNQVIIDDTFFSRHVEVDPRHGQSLIMPVRDWLANEELVNEIIDGASESLDARRAFLDDLLTHVTVN